MCVGVALLICVRLAGRNGTGAPPSFESSSWRWIGARPGLNIYYAARSSADNGSVSVWVDRRFFGSQASVNKDLVEVWEVDCARQRVRPAVASEPSWGSSRAVAPAGRLLQWVCADIDRRASR